jgi:putative DNA primase/helicase
MTSLDFGALNRAACAEGRSFVQRLIPGGRIRSLEYVVRNPRRNDQNPGSFSINYRTGQWADFATNDRGGDFVSLVGFIKGIGQGAAARELADMIGFPVPRFANGHEVLPVIKVGNVEPLVEFTPVPVSDVEREGTAFLPLRTPPDRSDKPKFIANVDGPPPEPEEVRRHIYRRIGVAVRHKIKFKTGRWVNWYRVVDANGTKGWQAAKPAGYIDVPYVTLGTNPFDPEIADDWLYWPEGEKDVDTISRLGVLAFSFGGTGDGLPPLVFRL